MLKVGIFGLGGCGCLVADRAAEEANFPAIGINTSAKDMKAIKKCEPIIIGDEKGAGKDMDVARKFFLATHEDIFKQEFVNTMIQDSDAIYIVSSIGGGSGTGLTYPFALQLKKHIKELGKTTPVVIFHILPTLKESYVAQANAKRYLSEILSTKFPYVSYDNNKYAGRPLDEIIENVNRDVVTDMRILRGDYISDAPYGIDDRELLNMHRVPGRIAIFHDADITQEKLNNDSIDTLLKNNYINSAITELGVDPLPTRMATIANFNGSISEDGFEMDHVLKNIFTIQTQNNAPQMTRDADKTNFVYVICSGLKPITERLTKIKDRIATYETEILSRNTDDGFNDLMASLSSSYNISDDLNDDDDEDFMDFSLDSFISKPSKPKKETVINKKSSK